MHFLSDNPTNMTITIVKFLTRHRLNVSFQLNENTRIVREEGGG